MFEQTKAFRIRFQLAEKDRGVIRNIRTINFDENGIHTFEGTLEDYEGRKRFLKNYNAVPLEEPDTSVPKGRPIPKGSGKGPKLASMLRTNDDMGDLSEFKDVPARSPAPQGNGKPASDSARPPESASGVRHGSGAGSAPGPAPGAPASGAGRVGSEDQSAQVEDEGFSL